MNAQGRDIQALEQEAFPRLKAQLNEKIETLETKLKMNEIHDRKYNLLFYGAKEEPNKTVYETVRHFFVTDFKLPPEDADGINIANAHRLPRRRQEGRVAGPDPIIVQFSFMGDVEYIMEASRTRGYFKDRKPVMVYSDLPSDMKRERGRLAQQAKRLRQDDGKTTRIRVQGIKVTLEFKARGKPGPWQTFKD